MANKYGQGAKLAAGRSLTASESPVEHWELAMQRLFPDSPSSRKKGCPKGAFLGLCEDGFVKGFGSGAYTTSQENKAYAVKAVALLRDGAAPDKAINLWRLVMRGQVKAHNSQMDVVLALWRSGMISDF